MAATTTQEMHFKKFLGHGALCGSDEETDLVTLQPDKVTCAGCLAAMGRSRTDSGLPATRKAPLR